MTGAWPVATDMWTIYPEFTACGGPSGLGPAAQRGPVGPLLLVAGPAGLRELRFAPHTPPDLERGALPEVTRQLDEYFGGVRRTFDLPLDLRGTDFQLGVWQQLLGVGYGETISYGELTSRVGEDGHDQITEPGASGACVGLGRSAPTRAVAQCVGRTPVPIIVPCHRIIGADGSLTGYGGGLDRKRTLLEHEGAIAQMSLAV